MHSNLKCGILVNKGTLQVRLSVSRNLQQTKTKRDFQVHSFCYPLLGDMFPPNKLVIPTASICLTVFSIRSK